ncbi:MAG: glycosyltransferase family 2 protein [Sulfuricella sp.]|nr:glycosyltransferase family 2 protein [Sulfuricella sp.]
MPSKLPLSAVIITRNEETRLAACLESVSFADEIVVVDSGSTDKTLEIALQYGARIFRQDWLGFGRQKQFAVMRASHDWVLCLDADERVSAELRASIEEVMRNPVFGAYRFPRRNRFMGRWLYHGEGYPDWSLRLFHRAHSRWSEDVIHEKVLMDTSLGTLRGDLLHESEESLAAYLQKQNSYTTLQAQTLHGKGKRAGVARLLVSPLLRFVKFYFVRLGLLDGVPGLVHILIGCFNSFAKYAKLRELNRE